jgi:hypothetical protein
MSPLPSAFKETHVFARRVYLHLKPNSVAELTKRVDKEILPMLRKLKGFHDEITFVNSRGTEAFAITIWDQAESAEVYSRSIYPAVMKVLSSLIDGAPEVDTFDVVNSTFHTIATVSSV